MFFNKILDLINTDDHKKIINNTTFIKIKTLYKIFFSIPTLLLLILLIVIGYDMLVHNELSGKSDYLFMIFAFTLYICYHLI